jgi:hypothetical protein
MVYGKEHNFKSLFGEWDSNVCSVNYYNTLFEQVLDEMVYEDLIKSEKREKFRRVSVVTYTSTKYYRVKLTVNGNRIKNNGGWIKYYNANRRKLFKGLWDRISHGNNLVGLLGGLLTIGAFVFVILRGCSTNESNTKGKLLTPQSTDFEKLDSIFQKKDSLR